MNIFKILLVFLFISTCISCKKKNKGSNINISSLTDKRDGQVYKVMKMKDGNYWMSENLNYGIKNSWCFENNQDNCTRYGRLYNWSAAVNSCPSGWKLPTEEEWRMMADFYKFSSKDSIDSSIEPNSKYPFWTREQNQNIFKNLTSIDFVSGKGVTGIAHGKFINLDITEQFWTSTPRGELLSYSYQFDSAFKGLSSKFLRNFKNTESGLYCRCLKEK